MKRLLKWTSSILLLLFFFHSCVYHYITHMNDEELAWVANRHEGEIMYFQSSNGTKDTAKIYKIEIYNSLNPFNMAYFNTSNTDYIAGGFICYSFNRATFIISPILAFLFWVLCIYMCACFSKVMTRKHLKNAMGYHFCSLAIYYLMLSFHGYSIVFRLLCPRESFQKVTLSCHGSYII